MDSYMKSRLHLNITSSPGKGGITENVRDFRGNPLSSPFWCWLWTSAESHLRHVYMAKCTCSNQHNRHTNTETHSWNTHHCGVYITTWVAASFVLPMCTVKSGFCIEFSFSKRLCCGWTVFFHLISPGGNTESRHWSSHNENGILNVFAPQEGAKRDLWF